MKVTFLSLSERSRGFCVFLLGTLDLLLHDPDIFVERVDHECKCNLRECLLEHPVSNKRLCPGKMLKDGLFIFLPFLTKPSRAHGYHGLADVLTLTCPLMRTS